MRCRMQRISFLSFRQVLCVVNEISHRIMAKSLDVGQMRITYSDFFNQIKSQILRIVFGYGSVIAVIRMNLREKIIKDRTKIALYNGKNGKTAPLKTEESDPWKTVPIDHIKTEEIDHLKTLEIAPPRESIKTLFVRRVLNKKI